MNITWYFYNNDKTFNDILNLMAYSTFILFFVGVFATVLLISGTMSDMVGVLVALLFIIIPTSLLGLSIWLVLKDHKADDSHLPVQYCTIPAQFVDQEVPKMQKVEERPQVKYIPIKMDPQYSRFKNSLYIYRLYIHYIMHNNN